MKSPPASNSEDGITQSACPEHCSIRRGVMWLIVFAQFVLAGAIVLLTGDPWRWDWPLLPTVLGLVIGGWAIGTVWFRSVLNVAPMVRSNARLVIQGPYRWVRHPMYTGLMLFCGGYVLAEPSGLAFGLWAGLTIVLAIKMYYEEGMLRRRFPEYGDYARRVRRLIPFLF